MDDESLRKKLEELELELLETPPGEQALQGRRDALAAQIRETLSHEDLGGLHISLKEFLDEEFLVFADTHPKIAALLNSIRDMLSSIGI